MGLYLGNSARKLILGGLRYNLHVGHMHNFVNAYTWAEDYSWCHAVGTCSICQKTIEETTTDVDIILEAEAACTSYATYGAYAKFNNSLLNEEYGEVVSYFEDTASGYDATNHTNVLVHYTTETAHSIYCRNCGLDHHQDGTWLDPEGHTPSRDLWNSDFDYHWPTCRVCEYKMVNQKEAHSFGDWTITEDGKRQKTCTVCGLVLQDNCQHNWTTSINWNDDYSICYASADCSKCGIHVETQSNYVVRIEDTPANCVSAAIMYSWVSSWVNNVGPFVNGGIDLNNDGMFDAVYSDTYEDPEAKLGPHTWNDLNGEGTDTGLGYKVKYCTVCEESVPLDHDPDICGDFGFDEITVESIEPTCTEDGYITTKCSYCEELIKDFEVIPALEHTGGTATCTQKAVCTRCHEEYGEAPGHNLVEDKYYHKDPTCTENGEEYWYCTRCDYTYTKTLPATGHSFGEWNTIKEPTTAEEGEKRRDCVKCDHYETSSIACLGHDCLDYEQIVIPAVPATCLTPGATAGEKCSGCGEITYAPVVIPAPGHQWVAKGDSRFSSGYGYVCSVCEELGEELTCSHESKTEIDGTYAEPTCTEEGYISYKCNACDKEWQEAIPATGHSYESTVTKPTCLEWGYTTHTCSNCGDSYTDSNTTPTGHSYESTITPPTCTEEGYTTHTCSCGHYYKDSYTSHTGHNYQSTVTEPTCTSDGYTTHACSNCDSSYDDNLVPATGHTSVTDEGYAATCTKTGLTEGSHCSVCNETIVAQETLPVLGHQEETLSAVAATCTETGLTEGKYCGRCDATLTEQQTIPATGHTPKLDDNGVNATCTESGLTRSKSCSVCGETIEAQVEIPALGHTETTVTKDSTCTDGGYWIKKCGRCGIELERVDYDPLGHKWESYEGSANDFYCPQCGSYASGSEILG